MSDLFPTRAAMIKSNGEQLAGQATLQGFSSQYSHLDSSTWSCALVMMSEATVLVSMEAPLLFLVNGISCNPEQLYSQRGLTGKK
jgi:hypothetical protein